MAHSIIVQCHGAIKGFIILQEAESGLSVADVPKTQSEEPLIEVVDNVVRLESTEMGQELMDPTPNLGNTCAYQFRLL